MPTATANGHAVKLASAGDGLEVEKTTTTSGSRQRGTSLTTGPTVGFEDLTIVEFSSGVYYCSEEEGQVVVEVSRLGKANKHCTVEYQTCDGSAKAGKKYEKKAGVIEFLPGETSHEIHIAIIENETFDAVLEFQVKLYNPSADLRLGSYLHECRVVISDDDVFPSNKYATLLKDSIGSKDSEAKVPRWPLMLEYIKMHLKNTHFRRCCIFNCLCDQFDNAHYAAWVFLLNYLIDRVLRPADGSDPPSNADEIVYTVAGLTLVPHILQYFLDRQKILRRVRGKAILKIQENLIRKFLNYDEGSRGLVSSSDLTMAISRDVPELVDDGLMTCFSLVKGIGLLVLLSALAWNQMSRVSVVFSTCLFLGYPIFMFAFLALRYKGTALRRRKLFAAQTNVVSLIQQTADCFRLISDYEQKPMIVSTFNGKVKACNGAFTEGALWEATNQHFAPLLSTVVCCIYILFSYKDVLNGTGPIGEFVTGVAVCRGIGNCWKNMYADLLKMLSAMAPLHNVVHYMNMPVDVPRRMLYGRKVLKYAKLQEKVVANKRDGGASSTDLRGIINDEAPVFYSQGTYSSEGTRQATKKKIKGVEKSSSFLEERLSVDDLEITATSITFSYPKSAGGGNLILNQACFSIPQGLLVAVTGPRGSGKATLLQMLGGVMFPNLAEGDVIPPLFVPPNLRVLHVSFQPQILSDFDLFENLCFGPSDGVDEDPERVVTICHRLGVSEKTMKHIRGDMNSNMAIPQESPISPFSQEKKFSVVSAMADSLGFQSLQREKSGLSEHTNSGGSVGNVALSRSPSNKSFAVRFNGGTPVGGIPTFQVGTYMSVARRTQVEQNANCDALLSHTDKCLLHIARALIMNPEVLVLHKPLTHFDDLQAWRVMDLLREFVECRGLQKPTNEFHLRRPRTCIWSNPSTKCTETSDLVFHVAHGKVKMLDVSAIDRLRQAARDLFKELDMDGDGKVNRDEFCHVMLNEPWAAKLFGVPDEYVDTTDPAKVKTGEDILSKVFGLLDRDSSDEVDFEELIQFMQGCFDERLAETMDTLNRHGQSHQWAVPTVPMEGRMSEQGGASSGRKHAPSTDSSRKHQASSSQARLNLVDGLFDT